MQINSEMTDFVEELEITARFAKKDGDLGLAELLSTASRTVADLAEQLKAAEQALDRCVDYIEADEMAHGRTFGAGVEGRRALHFIRGTQPQPTD